MIYLDNAATTKPLLSAVEKADKFLKDSYFNPSAMYKNGIETKKELEGFKNKILRHFPPIYDLTFTSCGTEADNTAIFSFCKRGNFITTLGEHSAVYECFNELKKRGADVRFAPLNLDGSVNVEELLKLVDEKTTFVSVVHVNNETGAINDVNAIAKQIKSKNQNVIFHSDGIQAFGKIPYVLSADIDLYSISAHKIGGLKGNGALIRKKKLNLTPYLIGGGQEGGLRSGTENVFGIAVFAEAVKAHFENIKENYQKVSSLKQLFIEKLDTSIIKIISSEKSSPYVLSLSAEGLRGEVVMHMLEDFGVIIGTGSACSSKNPHSRILKACGYGAKTLDGMLRISFCNNNTEEEILFAVEKLNECVKRLKGIMRK
jgi:cysteine desulfurase